MKNHTLRVKSTVIAFSTLKVMIIKRVNAAGALTVVNASMKKDASSMINLLPGDQFFWGRGYHTVYNTWERPDGRLGIFFRDGLTISVDPAELQEIK